MTSARGVPSTSAGSHASRMFRVSWTGSNGPTVADMQNASNEIRSPEPRGRRRLRPQDLGGHLHRLDGESDDEHHQQAGHLGGE